MPGISFAHKHINFSTALVYFFLVSFATLGHAHVVIEGDNGSREYKSLYYRTGEALERYVCDSSVIVVSPSNCTIKPRAEALANSVYNRISERISRPIPALEKLTAALGSNLASIDTKIDELINHAPGGTEATPEVQAAHAIILDLRETLSELAIQEAEMTRQLDALTSATNANRDVLRQTSELKMKIADTKGRIDQNLSALTEAREKYLDLVAHSLNFGVSLQALRNQRKEQALKYLEVLNKSEELMRQLKETHQFFYQMVEDRSFTFSVPYDRIGTSDYPYPEIKVPNSGNIPGSHSRFSSHSRGKLS